MTSIEFIYNGNNFIIQCDLYDKLKDIINKFLSKVLIEKNLLIFLYSGNIIDEDLKLNELIGNKKTDRIKILVQSISEIDNNTSIIKSKYIICPKCKENINFKIINYKICLYECKNKHRINNIIFNEFEKTQLLDISQIICDICKQNNKSNTYKNEFYKCLTCNINICPLCKSSHDKKHNIIKYENKDYICQKHNDIYI